MAEQNKTTNNKTRLILRTVFGCIAVVSLAVMVLISPFGKKLFGKDEETTLAAIPGNLETEEFTVSKNPNATDGGKVVSTESTEQTAESVSFSVPQPTQPTENPDKNYAVLINSYKFNHSEENGITSAVAKDNDKVTFTVTPKSELSYSQLCEKTKSQYGSAVSNTKLKIANANTFYSSTKDNIVTTVVCVDDGVGGSIEIKFTCPADENGYDSDFDLSLSMFSVRNAD